MKELDLKGYVDNLYDIIEEKFEDSDWSRKDLGYFEYKPKFRKNERGVYLPESWIVLYPDLLEYCEGSKWVRKIWLKSGDKEVSPEALKALTDIFKPFQDQDYCGNDIWINPLQPEGYLSNHALG
jgi:hypothetical protein